jgi:hypothetical protein
VLTDDVAAVRVTEGGQCLLRPAGPWLRLMDDSRAVLEGADQPGFFQWDKHLFDVSRGHPPATIGVRLIYLLTDGDELRRATISPSSATALLSNNSFVRHWRMNREALRAHLRDCATVASAVPLYRLTRPRSLSGLPEVVRRIEREIADEI